MSPWQALIAGQHAPQTEHWPEPVKRSGRDLSVRRLEPQKGTVRPLHPSQFAPPMSALCECGLRYGAHRVKDYACPNQKWRPGNGEPQWMERAVFVRADSKFVHQPDATKESA